MADETVGAVLAARAQRDPDGPALAFLGGPSLSGAEVLDLFQRTAAVLADRGAAPGTRVAVMGGNRLETLAAFFGAVVAGALPVPVNTALRGDSLRHVLDDAEPAVVLVEDVHRAVVSEVVAGTRHEARVHALDAGFLDAARRAAPAPVHPAAPPDPAAVLYTSGTTGRPKGVVWPHAMIGGFLDSVDAVLGLTPDDVSFSCLPLFHANALFTTFLASMRAGGVAVFSPRFSASGYWAEARQAGATAISLLGSMVPILWNNPPDARDGQNRVRIALTAPAPLPSYRDGFEARFGLVTTEVYGSTDAGLPIGVPLGERAPDESCGRALPGWEVQVVDAGDEPVPVGETGELVVRPLRPFLTQCGYWRRPDATVEAWRNFWLHTGDLVSRDAEGWVRFVDRTKDSIRRGGENISSFEIELTLMTHPAVAKAAAFAVPSELVEDEVMAVVTLEPGQGVGYEELVEFCGQRLPYFAVPRYLEIVDALPMTQTEKIQKDELRRRGVTPERTYDRGPRRYVPASPSRS